MATSVAARKISRRPGAWFEGQLRRIGDRLFAAQDARARQRGWQITRQQAGLGRVYRDPRFDLLTTRPAAEARRVQGAVPRLPSARRRTPDCQARPTGAATAMTMAPRRPANGRQALAELQAAVGSVARPNLLVLAWRWRYELILAAAIAAGGIALARTPASIWMLAGCAVPITIAASWPSVGRALFRCARVGKRRWAAWNSKRRACAHSCSAALAIRRSRPKKMAACSNS